MPIRVRCPNGHELIAEDQFIGRKIRCPACRVVMIVPDPRPAVTITPPAPPRPPAFVPPAPPPPDFRRPAGHVDEDEEPVVEEEEYPRRRRRRREEEEEDDIPRRNRSMKTGQRMAWVNFGLIFHYANMLCWIAALALLMVAWFVLPILTVGATASAMGGDMKTAQSAAGAAYTIGMIVGWFTAIALFAAPTLGAIGSSFCFVVPNKTGARVLIIVSFALDTAASVFFMVHIITNMIGSSGGAASLGAVEGAIILFLVACLLTLAGWILFMVFVRQLALFLKDRGTATEALQAMIVTLVIAIAGPPILIGFGFALRFLGCIGAIFFFIIVGFWLGTYLVWLFKILAILGTVRQRIATKY
ncbi:MAG: hypothetical protein L0Z62_35080 [Gemmataceae bacterium]|nr:hypothetical protein [Gemmataceae bacterium]